MSLAPGDRGYAVPDGKGGYYLLKSPTLAEGERGLALPQNTALKSSTLSEGDRGLAYPDSKGGYYLVRPEKAPLSNGWSFLCVYNNSIFTGWEPRTGVDVAGNGFKNIPHLCIREYIGSSYTDYIVNHTYTYGYYHFKSGSKLYFSMTPDPTGSYNAVIIFDMETRHFSRCYVTVDTQHGGGTCPEIGGGGVTDPPYTLYAKSTFGRVVSDGTYCYFTVPNPIVSKSGCGGLTAVYKVTIDDLYVESTLHTVSAEENYGHPGILDTDLSFRTCGLGPPYVWGTCVTSGWTGTARDIAVLDGALYVEAYNYHTSKWQLMTPHNYAYDGEWDVVCDMPDSRPDMKHVSGDLAVFNGELYTISDSSIYILNSGSLSKICDLPDGFEPMNFYVNDDDEKLYICGYGGAYYLDTAENEMVLIGDPSEEGEFVNSVALYKGRYIYGIVEKSYWEALSQYQDITGRLYPDSI